MSYLKWIFLFFAPLHIPWASPANITLERPWLLQDEQNTINTFKQSDNEVVYVSTLAKVRDFFSNDVFEVPAGTGTGFFWDDQGHIVTNFHVIAQAWSEQNPRQGRSRRRGRRRSAESSLTVNLKDGRSFEAEIKGVFPSKDIAVLKIKKDKKKSLPKGFSQKLADSSKVLVGQKTIAIGNPFELSHTLTTGVVSALERSVPSPLGENYTIRDMIQTDAAINPGNSGGPLMDSRGHLIGMNTAIFSKSGSSAGVGFAVPSNTIKRVVTQIISKGKVIRAGLGIEVVPQSYAEYMGFEGVMVGRAAKGSAAQKAGLRGVRFPKGRRRGDPEMGDIITNVDGKKVESFDDLQNALDGKNVGEKVQLTYKRKGKTRNTKVKLQEIPSDF